VIDGSGGKTHWKCKFCNKDWVREGHFLGLESLVRARASTGLTSALGRDVQASEGSPGKVAEKGERGQTLQTSEEEAQEYVVGSQGFAGRGCRRSCGGGSANSG